MNISLQNKIDELFNQSDADPDSFLSYCSKVYEGLDKIEKIRILEALTLLLRQINTRITKEFTQHHELYWDKDNKQLDQVTSLRDSFISITKWIYTRLQYEDEPDIVRTIVIFCKTNINQFLGHPTELNTFIEDLHFSLLKNNDLYQSEFDEMTDAVENSQ